MKVPNKLKIASYLAPNMFWFYSAVGAYLSRVLGVETAIVQSQYDPLSDPLLLQDRLDLMFICGLPFTRCDRAFPHQLQALVAPVMQATRYQGCPVYFSDIIVNANSSLKTFDDLAGKTFCYNDPGSNSGYNLVLQKLFQSGYPISFFGKAIQSGSHQNSIELVIEGTADCSAIDSVVLEQQLRDLPQLAKSLRVIEPIGPCPMPPVVASQRLGLALIHLIQSALCQPDIELQLAMKHAQIQQYVKVQSKDYTRLATIYDTVSQAGYKF